MKKTIVLYLIITILVMGCATWVAVEGKYSMSSQNFEVEIPDGWRRFNLSQDALIITKDGLTLQQIQIMRRSVDKELPHTKKKILKEMLPQEIAEVLIDNIRSNPDIMNQNFIENVPEQIGGFSGIKLVYTYQTKGGLTKKGVNYCFLFGNWCYEINYEAPERYYFTKDLPAFEQVVESFRLIKATVS
jgi:hypothetical protein